MKKLTERWQKALDKQQGSSTLTRQFQWIAAVLQYVDKLHHLTSLHGNAKKTQTPLLPDDFPILGPRFVPVVPTLLAKRSARALTPEDYYIKPLTVVHPCYDNLATFGCPGCRKRESTPPIKWQQWSATGPRRVHGLESVEYAIGIQMRCGTCRDKIEKEAPGPADGKKSDEKQHCSWSTTSHKFWEGISYWKIPRKCSSGSKDWSKLYFA